MINSGRAEGAVEPLRLLTESQPALGGAWNLLAVALHAGGRAGEALAAARRACEIEPGRAEFVNALAALLVETGAHDEARAAFERLLAARPDDGLALFNLSNLEWIRGGYWRSIDLLRRASAAQPDDRDVAFQLGSSLCSVGRVRECLEVCERFRKRSAKNRVDPMVLAARAFAMLGASDVSAADLSASHRELGAANEAGVWAMPPQGGPRHPGPIRVGLLSPDFREHPVARFVLPLAERLDRARFHLVAYSSSTAVDATTARLRSAVERDGGVWRDIIAMSDDDAAAVVRGDEIDVLVDLAGNTVGSRPGLFARRPARAAVSWLGYPATSGMRSVGYRLVDGLTDPAGGVGIGGGDGGADAQCTERLVRMAGCFVCYRPPVDEGGNTPSPQPRVAGAETGTVRFGCFGSLHKHSDACLGAWAEILRRVPGSVLVVKSMMLGDERVAADVRARLGSAGIAAPRLRILPPTASATGHLRVYDDVDIALDSFPYHGTTTTCDALFMGVPVVAIAGASHHARVGVSLLSAVGLDEFVAGDESEYVEKAVALAADGSRRRELHATLRARLERSPLRDEAGFAKRWGESIAACVGG